MKQSSLLLALLLLGSPGCSIDTRGTLDSGGGGGGDGGIGGGDGGGSRIDFARITGRVWAPGNAPGSVPAGQEIPVFDALVRVSPTRVPPIPDTVYCDQCVAVSGPHARTTHDGRFEVGSIVPGTYWVTVEKGQFRTETQITLAANEVLDLAAAASTLPSAHDPANGRTVPRVAIAAGTYDHLEDVLGKMGMGGVDSGYEWNQTADGRMDVYTNGSSRGYSDEGSLESLVRDLNRMLRYHIIFIPCASGGNAGALQDQTVLNNLRQYVAMGGKLYVTDWSGEWMDNVFPAFIELDDADDTPASAYNATTNTWNTSQFGDADGSYYDSEDAEAVDTDLHTWLNGQMGPTPGSDTPAVYNASSFEVQENYNVIMNLNRIQVGVDAEGLPVTDMPIAYVIGDQDGSTPKRPLTVTFEPAGCGRVLYSTYHTTPGEHQGLVAQERILLYLIMQIGICIEDPILI